MIFPTVYNCLSQNEFALADYKIVPIRYEDRLDIMKWRNEQMYHLRQDMPLTEESQENYYTKTLFHLFDNDKPNQILFSFLKKNKCIGYGGLVHINWIDKNSEISFIMNTDLEKTNFSSYWKIFLKLIEKVAFKELNFKKIFTFAFDLRPYLYSTLEASGFLKEAILKEHFFFDGEYKDVIIHTKFDHSNNI